jgi:hypothetical protein
MTEQQGLNVWVDDEREAPEGWVWDKTVESAIFTLQSYRVHHLALDYVMGRGKNTGAIMEWLRDHPDRWPTGEITCHSDSFDAQKLIEEMVKDYAP